MRNNIPANAWRGGILLSALIVCTSATRGEDVPAFFPEDDNHPVKVGRQHRQNNDSSPAVFVPCVGRGYRPYGYPAFGSCPCGESTCFHPFCYYCGGKPYRRSWFKTWLRAHLGSGSMLERYSCECQHPLTGKPYRLTEPR